MSTVVLVLGAASLTLVTAYRGADMLATSLAESSSSESTSSESSSSIPSSSSTSSETVSSISSSTSSIVTSNKCIVTIKGSKYDVTTLRNTHSGGDIFVCNSDMTTTFTNQHGSDLARIKQYLVTTTGTKTTVKVVTKGTEVFTEISLATHNKAGNSRITNKYCTSI
jgi:cytochrome b involved in lipid metabolism